MNRYQMIGVFLLAATIAMAGAMVVRQMRNGTKLTTAPMTTTSSVSANGTVTYTYSVVAINTGPLNMPICIALAAIGVAGVGLLIFGSMKRRN